MAALMADTGDAIVSVLAEHDFGLVLAVARSYADLELKLEEAANELRVDVIPVRHEDSQLDSEGSTGFKISYDIGIRKRFKPESLDSDGRVLKAEVDALVLLVEKIHMFLCSPEVRRLPDWESASWNETNIRATYIPKHLKDWKQFTGLIRVHYDVFTAVP